MNKNKMIIFLLVQAVALYSSEKNSSKPSSEKLRKNLGLALRSELYAKNNFASNSQNLQNGLLSRFEELRSSPPSYYDIQSLSPALSPDVQEKILVCEESVDEDFIRVGTPAARQACRFAALKNVSVFVVTHGYLPGPELDKKQ